MSGAARRIWDVSVPIRHGGLVYPNNPPISITPVQTIAAGNMANVSRIDLGSHTGTHVDAPLHFVDGGAGVDELPLDVLVGPARLIAFADDVLAVGEAELRRHDLAGVTRLLIKTRNSAWLASGDRKSTRLNSSHANISYAVFCLKKKKKKTITSSLTANKNKHRQHI